MGYMVLACGRKSRLNWGNRPNGLGWGEKGNDSVAHSRDVSPGVHGCSAGKQEE